MTKRFKCDILKIDKNRIEKKSNLGDAMGKNLITELKTSLNFLTKVESKIAREIIDNPSAFITYSMSELAKKADVSQGSIINFSNKFAEGGFPELKLRISACIGVQKKQQYNIVDANDSLKDALRKNADSLSLAYKHTDEINSEQTFEQVVERILKARKIEIYGIFRSATVATDFCYQLLELGIPASFVSDILTCSISASMLDESALVIAISSSGKTKDIIDAVKNAKANNVPIISITSNPNSPLAKLSDNVLVAPASGVSVSSRATEIRSSQLLITDTICSYIRRKIDFKNESRYYKLKTILSSHSVKEGENE